MKTSEPTSYRVLGRLLSREEMAHVSGGTGNGGGKIVTTPQTDGCSTTTGSGGGDSKPTPCPPG